MTTRHNAMSSRHKDRSCYARPALSPADLLAGEVSLAVPPELFLRLNAVLDDPKHTQQQVVHLIEHDPALSARLLRIVNSPFYGGCGRIDSIAQAVNLIGSVELRDLALATVIVERFSSLSNGLMSMREFWSLSVRCALLARALAARHPQGGRLVSMFIAGLLHEIGRLVLYHRLPDLARAALLRSRHENIPEHKAQREEMGLDHYQVGAELVRRWCLPEVIGVAMENHEAPERAVCYVEECRILALASRLAMSGGEALAPATEEMEQWEALSMGVGLWEEVLTDVERAFQEVFQQIFTVG